jgi:hypothetical protein
MGFSGRIPADYAQTGSFIVQVGFFKFLAYFLTKLA